MKIVTMFDKVSFQHEADEPFVTPIVHVTLAVVVASTSITLNDEDDAKSFISSLSKLFEKNKSIKSLETSLNSVLDIMAKTMTLVIIESNTQ